MYRKLFVLYFILQILINVHGEVGNKINSKNCGIYKTGGFINSRIVGGKHVNITRYPWTVSFQKKLSSEGESEHFCGGSIINERWLLSASHCFQGVKHSIKKVRAVVGTTDWNGPDGVAYELDRVVMHENYNTFNYSDDIALIKTKTDIKFINDSNFFHINTICLVKPNHRMPETASVYGWGLLGEYSDISVGLMKATLDKTDLNKCYQVYREYIGKLSKKMMCYSRPGKDACQGDSGGPLSHQHNGQEHLIGIVSFGLGCGRPNVPGIYTNVGLYEGWIKKTIENIDVI